MFIITIDTGTTNTRVCLWNKYEFVASIQKPVGVRNTSIDGNNTQITQSISDAFAELLLKQKIDDSAIRLVLAAGMITSNLGLVEVPHLIAPAKKIDFSNGIHSEVIPAICPQPIHFIPGLKNTANVSDRQIEAVDFMRGEEVETIALLDLTQQKKSIVFILPGSHTKIVAINDALEITGCCTSLAGELISVITHNTILTSSLQDSFTAQLDRDYLQQGAESCQRVGLTRSLFTIRTLEQTANIDRDKLGSFLLGIVLSEDIKALFTSSALALNKSARIGIYGNSPVSHGFKILLDARDPTVDCFMIEDKLSGNLSGYGSLLVAKSAGLMEFQNLNVK
jgi:2-dehydro-3-deoxygalactonokinase